MAGLASILWAVIVIMILLWIAGLLFHILGGFIHILLVIAIVLIVVNLLTGRRAV